jgi:hypothetical protein
MKEYYDVGIPENYFVNKNENSFTIAVKFLDIG